MADLDAVMAVEQASFDPAWSRASWAEGIAPADHRLTLVAGDDEVAAVATFHGFDVADLDRIMVTPAAAWARPGRRTARPWPGLGDVPGVSHHDA